MIIDGKQISQNLKDEMREEVATLKNWYGRQPSLAIILVGGNSVSSFYVKSKVKAAEYVGIRPILIEMPVDVSEAHIMAEIDRLNHDDQVDGVLVQLPLPEHINEDRVVAAVDPEKDVDGFHPMNVGRLWLNHESLVPCTHRGIMVLLEKAGIELVGKKAVIVGHRNVEGKQVAKLLLDRNATVTLADRHTRNLAQVCKEADIIVIAVGRPRFLTTDYVKPGATVIDMGINRLEDGTVVGDVDFEHVAPIAGAITPMPGGVGPMTITMLLRNTIEVFQARQIKLKNQ